MPEEINNNESIKLIIQTFQKVNENKEAWSTKRRVWLFLINEYSSITWKSITVIMWARTTITNKLKKENDIIKNERKKIQENKKEVGENENNIEEKSEENIGNTKITLNKISQYKNPFIDFINQNKEKTFLESNKNQNEIIQKLSFNTSSNENPFNNIFKKEDNSENKLLNSNKTNVEKDNNTIKNEIEKKLEENKKTRYKRGKERFVL